MYDFTTAGTLVAGFVAVLYIGRRILGSKSSYPLPPGPPGIPWVGNVSGVNPDAPWETYAEWAKTYGRLRRVRLRVLYSAGYPCRRPNLYSIIGKGCPHHQFGKGRKGPAREPVHQLFRPPVPDLE